MATSSASYTSSSDESSSDESDPTGVAKKLFMRRLPQSINIDQIKQYFEKFGPLKHVHLVMDPATKKHRGYGFLKFQDNETCTKVLQTPQHVLGEQVIVVQTFNLRKRSENKLFVEGLSNFTTKLDLVAYFMSYGRVKKVIMSVEDSQLPPGAAYVTFYQEGVVESILEQQHNIDDRNIRCSKPQPTGELGPVSSIQLNEAPIAVTEPADETPIILDIPGDLPSVP